MLKIFQINNKLDIQFRLSAMENEKKGMKILHDVRLTPKIT